MLRKTADGFEGSTGPSGHKGAAAHVIGTCNNGRGEKKRILEAYAADIRGEVNISDLVCRQRDGRAFYTEKQIADSNRLLSARKHARRFAWCIAIGAVTVDFSHSSAVIAKV